MEVYLPTGHRTRAAWKWMDALPGLVYLHHMFGKREWLRGLGLGLLLAGVTLTAYWQVRHFEFTQYDDQDYVVRNDMVRSGLSWEGVRWALTTSHFSYWHPLTWMSHMLDCHWFDLQAGAHHLTNVFWHIAATLALFLALTRLTGALERSAVVAGLFALHPLHVESVAWIAERKDVLSTFFWFLTLWAYARYAERTSLGRYAATLFLFLLGLMSKPMLVTVPCVLLLLDYWPLRRLTLFPQRTPDQQKEGWRGWLQAVHQQSATPVSRLLLEKIPFLVLALGSSAITFLGVWRSDRVFSVESVPIGFRLANVPVSYVRYLGKMLNPEGLVVIYPLPDRWETWQVFGSAFLLLVFSGVVLLYVRRAPYLLVGWLWFLGTLVPTIGLIPVGWQSIADRYTYVPLVGVFLMLTWAAADLWGSRPHRAWALGGGATLILILLGLGTWLQTRHWRNNETLFQHAVHVSTNNAIAQYNLALTFQLQGRWADAVRHYRETIRAEPRKVEAYNNLGFLFNSFGQIDLATNYLLKGLRINPQNENLHVNLGNSLASQGRWEEAFFHYDEALRLNPDYAEAYAQKGWLSLQQGQLGPGLAAYRHAVQLKPDLGRVQAHLAWLLATHPDPAWRDGPAALTHARLACTPVPGASPNPSHLLALAAALAATGQYSEAVTSIHQALTLAESDGPRALSEKARKMLASFEAGQPYLEEPVMDWDQ